jgi:frataxin
LRHYASASPAPHVADPSPISVQQYHFLSDTFIDALVAELEELQEEREEVDVEYSAGVLTLVFPPAGTYILNKQPPNKQIWLSSPVSGPKRYDWVEKSVEGVGGEGEWVYLRDGSTLKGLLREEVGVKLEDGE